MKQILTLALMLIFAASLTACSSAPEKMPDSMPASEMKDMKPESMPASKMEEGTATPKKSLKKFEGNRMERADDGDE